MILVQLVILPELVILVILLNLLNLVILVKLAILVMLEELVVLVNLVKLVIESRNLKKRFLQVRRKGIGFCTESEVGWNWMVHLGGD